LHPYFLKVDSSGNFEWETVIYKETNLDGGAAWNTVLSPNGIYYYASLSHYLFDYNQILPALAKLDQQGNVVGIYDVVYSYMFGGLRSVKFLNNSTLAANAAWGDSEDELWSRAVTIDTLGNLLNSTVLSQDIYGSILQITYDGKLVYGTNTYQNNQFDCFLTKLNQNLEDDTLYTFPFTYDSLCPYQIVSDTIVQDDCGLIVGVEEEDKTVRLYDDVLKGLTLYPNPASGVLSVECLGLSEFEDLELLIYNVFGRSVVANIISSPMEAGGREGGGAGGEVSWTINVSSLPPGIYLAVVREGTSIVASGKFVVLR
jgi:hypothetical protein